ncbi:MAG: iron-sulfur cluster repair di-iron protein [Bacteroidales bacterium]
MIDTKYEQKTVGQIVAENFRTAEVFKSAGIDFCCGGNKTLDESCIELGIHQESLLRMIEEVQLIKPDYAHNYNEWEISFLADYIRNTHHEYVKNNILQIKGYTTKISNVHGQNHPELIEIAILFEKIYEELSQHLINEENVLFPAIKEIVKSGSGDAGKIIKSEIERMNGEHEFAGSSMDRIKKLSKGYILPEDACPTYRLAYKYLSEFEEDLHVHVHLENNILFPKALQLTN